MRSYSCCTPEGSTNTASFVSLLKIVAEESRVKLLCLLHKNTHCVCELAEHTGMSQSLVSHHLSDLKQAALVVDDKQGLRVYYLLTQKGKYVTELLLQMAARPDDLEKGGDSMQIQVLGTGCTTCKKFHEVVKTAVAEMEIEARIAYITGTEGMEKMVSLGAMTSPVLVVDEEIVMTGFTPDTEAVKKVLRKK